MTPQQAAYRAGCIVSEIEHRLAGPKGLSATALSNCCRLPSRIPVFLRHLWPKALQNKEIDSLIEGWECPDRPFADVESGPFWIGYYHQKAARDLPAGFGAKLKSLRESASLSREQLADAAGITRESVRLYELGERRPTWDAVQSLATVLGVTTDTFNDRT